MKNPKLIEALHARGMSVTKLAMAAGVTHSQASLTLNNTPGRGHLTRPKLAKLMTAEELTLVGWDGNGKKMSELVSQGMGELRAQEIAAQPLADSPTH